MSVNKLPSLANVSENFNNVKVSSESNIKIGLFNNRFKTEYFARKKIEKLYAIMDSKNVKSLKRFFIFSIIATAEQALKKGNRAVSENLFSEVQKLINNEEMIQKLYQKHRKTSIEVQNYDIERKVEREIRQLLNEHTNKEINNDVYEKLSVNSEKTDVIYEITNKSKGYDEASSKSDEIVEKIFNKIHTEEAYNSKVLLEKSGKTSRFNKQA